MDKMALLVEKEVCIVSVLDLKDVADKGIGSQRVSEGPLCFLKTLCLGTLF